MKLFGLTISIFLSQGVFTEEVTLDDIALFKQQLLDSAQALHDESKQNIANPPTYNATYTGTNWQELGNKWAAQGAEWAKLGQMYSQVNYNDTEGASNMT